MPLGFGGESLLAGIWDGQFDWSSLFGSDAGSLPRSSGGSTNSKASSFLQTYMDISINGMPQGRMTFDLFDYQVPKTANNFRALCAGETSQNNGLGPALRYRGSKFHRIIP